MGGGSSSGSSNPDYRQLLQGEKEREAHRLQGDIEKTLEEISAKVTAHSKTCLPSPGSEGEADRHKRDAILLLQKLAEQVCADNDLDFELIWEVLCEWIESAEIVGETLREAFLCLLDSIITQIQPHTAPASLSQKDCQRLLNALRSAQKQFQHAHSIREWRVYFS